MAIFFILLVYGFTWNRSTLDIFLSPCTLQVVEEKEESRYGYGKRPLWQWILLYVVLGTIAYALIYYFVFAKHSGYTYQVPSSQSQYASPTVSPSNSPSSNIYMTKTDTTKGTYMTDFAGITLYTFDKDTPGVSTCYNGCANLWPPYTSGATAQGNLPENITVITRTGGAKQFAWKGMPLYYYATDAKPGDILGDGVGGVWHIVKM